MSVYRNTEAQGHECSLPCTHKPEAHIFNLLPNIGHSLSNHHVILTSCAQELNHVVMLRLRVCISVELKAYSLLLESLMEI